MNVASSCSSEPPPWKDTCTAARPPPAGETRSPACRIANTSAPGGPGTTPPLWKVGSFGIENPDPPIFGTQPGTVNDSCPTVLFQKRAMALKPAFHGALIMSAIRPNAPPTMAGKPFSQSHTASAAALIPPQATRQIV